MLRFYAWSSALSAWQCRWWDAHSRLAVESFWMPTHSFTQGFKVFIVSFCACILPKQSEAAGSSQGLCNHHYPLVKEFTEMPLTRTVFYLHSILCHCSDLNHCNGIAHHRLSLPLDLFMLSSNRWVMQFPYPIFRAYFLRPLPEPSRRKMAHSEKQQKSGYLKGGL